jgi:hypothetical protein
MLADLLAADGSTVGLAAPNGVFINGSRADGGEMELPAATRRLLLDPTVELAVVDVPLQDALAHGLGYDWADACAIINDEPIESSELVAALSLVAGTARSHLVISPEDERTYGVKPHPGARVWHVNGDGAAHAEAHATALALCLGRERNDVERRLASLSESHAS